MAKRKLKKSVKLSLLAMGILLSGSLLLNDSSKSKENASANEIEVVAEKELSYLEALEKNEELSKGYFEGFEAFYLYDEGEHSLFMENSSMNVYSVPKSVVKESYAINLQMGDNVKLSATNSMDVQFVEVVSGKSITMEDMELYQMNKENTNAIYLCNDEKYVVFNDFIERFNLKNSTIGSAVTGYFFNSQLIGIAK